VYDKYGSRNPVVRALVRSFLGAAVDLARAGSPRRILEAGCGEGFVLNHLREHLRPRHAHGSDLSLPVVVQASRRYPQMTFTAASICDLPFRSGAFDLVVACEVLEHVDDPRRALEELLRVTSRFALLSVPHEPWWRVLNVLRGKYLRDRGNTPGHVQHFTAAAFRGFLGAQCRVSRFARPTPWLMALCERRAAPGAAGGESAEIGER